MKAFALTAGTIFGLIVIAHIWRIASESRALAHDPWFILLTVAAAGLCIWAFRVASVNARANGDAKGASGGKLDEK